MWGMDIIYCLIILVSVNHHGNLWIVKLSRGELQTMPSMFLLFPYFQFKVHTFSLGLIQFDIQTSLENAAFWIRSSI